MTAPTIANRTQAWSEAAIRQLLDTESCPACGAPGVTDRRCAGCRADFAGDIGGELWDASQAAVAALRTRQTVLDRVPTVQVARALAPAAPRAAASVPPVDLAPRSSATVQSVLAVAGAGLVAVAAIVFTFFNPDLTDGVLRSLIVAAITVVFLVAARVLVRRGLQFSAEAVGALGMVFLGLDVYSISETAPPQVSPWVFAAIGTLVGGGLMAALGVRFGIRVWLWTSLVALSFVPAMLGIAAGPGIGAVAGWLSAAGAAFALIELASRLARSFGSDLLAERAALTVAQLLFIGVAVTQVSFVPTAIPFSFWLLASAVLLTISVLSALSARHPAGGLWSFIAGATGVGAVAVLPLTLGVWGQWQLALVPAAASLGLVAIGALLRIPHAIVRTAVIGGALFTVALTALAPTVTALGIGAPRRCSSSCHRPSRHP